MLPSAKSLAVATALILGCCSALENQKGVLAGPPGNSPYCGPCVPERVSYGYFPPTWRRWPTERVEPAASRRGEEMPTPATPETRTSPIEPVEPDDTLPQQPDDLPLEPPFGEAPAQPPLDTGPIQLPFGDEPPPFDDAPPALPSEPKDSTLPFDPTLPPDSMPSSEDLPEPANQVLPDAGATPLPSGDLPPSMPDDDPFKDDPEQGLSPAADPVPESGAREDLDAIRQQASIRWQGKGEPPGQLQQLPALPLSDRDAPPRLEVSERPPTRLQPASRVNPLRTTRSTGRPGRIVPAASLSAADTAPAAGRDMTWRSNPLRSN